MNIIESLREKAKNKKVKIVLPEGSEERVVLAAETIAKENIAAPILVGNKTVIEELAAKNSITLSGVEIHEPFTDSKSDDIVAQYYELRKHKGITTELARKAVEKNPVNYAALMVRLGMADGMVAGACITTSNVARAAIYCLEKDKQVGSVSSCFLMELENCPYGVDGFFVFGDCGIIPNPNSVQLAEIAIGCSNMLHSLFSLKPKVAFLSYSTKGSARGESVNKVVEALKIMKEKAPGIDADGELQADAAIVPNVAKIKCGESAVGGQANVLVFPNLDAGNICYKIAHRLGNARVVGPILMGLTRPTSDLSRGCGITEIVDAVAVTAIRAQYMTGALNLENTCNKLR